MKRLIAAACSSLIMLIAFYPSIADVTYKDASLRAESWTDSMHRFRDNENIAQQGCCSWHDGVCGCSDGSVTCCDGSTSPTCTCNADDRLEIASRLKWE
jgi:hypothetical protein